MVTALTASLAAAATAANPITAVALWKKKNEI